MFQTLDIFVLQGARKVLPQDMVGLIHKLSASNEIFDRQVDSFSALDGRKGGNPCQGKFLLYVLQLLSH